MEEICERENCKQALARVKANKSNDGMTVERLLDYLKQRWPEIREQLLSGTYKPQPVSEWKFPNRKQRRKRFQDGKSGLKKVCERFGLLGFIIRKKWKQVPHTIV